MMMGRVGKKMLQFAKPCYTGGKLRTEKGYKVESLVYIYMYSSAP